MRQRVVYSSEDSVLDWSTGSEATELMVDGRVVILEMVFLWGVLVMFWGY